MCILYNEINYSKKRMKERATNKEPKEITLLKKDIRNGGFKNGYDLEKHLKVRSLRDSYELK